MNLKQYAERHSQKGLADLIGAKPSFVNQWIRLGRPVPIPTCVLIEQRTGGAVTRRELRPKDWHLIWPELADKAEA